MGWYNSGTWTNLKRAGDLKNILSQLCIALNEREECTAKFHSDFYSASKIIVNTISSITRSGSTATITTNNHGLTTGRWVRISGADQTEYNGDFKITVTGTTTFTYTVSGTPATPATGTFTLKYLVVPKTEFVYDNDGNTKTKPSASDLVGLWIQSTVVNEKTLTSITRSGSTATATLANHGYPNLAIVEISGADQVEYNGEQLISNVTTNTFDYSVGSGTPASPATGTLTALATGNWAGSVTRSGATVTVNSAAHGYSAGQWVSIRGATDDAYNGVFQIASASANAFTYTITGTPTSPASGTIQAHRIVGIAVLIAQLRAGIEALCEMANEPSDVWFADPDDMTEPISLSSLLGAGSFGSTWVAADNPVNPDIYMQIQEALAALIYVSEGLRIEDDASSGTGYRCLIQSFGSGNHASVLETAWDNAVAAIAAGVLQSTIVLRRLATGSSIFGVSLVDSSDVNYLALALQDGDFVEGYLNFVDIHAGTNSGQSVFSGSDADADSYDVDASHGASTPTLFPKGEAFFSGAPSVTIAQDSYPASHPFPALTLGSPTESSDRRLEISQTFHGYHTRDISSAMTYG